MFPSDHTRSVNDPLLFVLTLIILLSISTLHSGPPEIIWERDLTTGFDCCFWGVDFNGNLQWSRTFGTPESDIAYSVTTLRDGDFALAGSTMESGSYQADIWLVRTGFSWEEIWTYEIEGEDNDSVWDVVEPETGGYIDNYTFHRCRSASAYPVGTG